jgi:hypothetical protein
MNLMIELDDELIIGIVNRYLRSTLKVNEYGSQTSLVEYIQEQVKSATMDYLKGVDWKTLIHAIASERLDAISRDVVSRTIEKHVKRVVKELNDKGELV